MPKQTTTTSTTTKILSQDAQNKKRPCPGGFVFSMDMKTVFFYLDAHDFHMCAALALAQALPLDPDGPAETLGWASRDGGHAEDNSRWVLGIPLVQHQNSQASCFTLDSRRVPEELRPTPRFCLYLNTMASYGWLQIRLPQAFRLM